MDTLLSIINRAEQFAVPSKEVETNVVSVLKELFDESCSYDEKQIGPIDSLIVENMDADTIWEELACRNRPLTRNIQRKLSKLLQVTKEREEFSKVQMQKQQQKGKGRAQAKTPKEAVTSDEDSSSIDDEEEEPAFDEEEDEEEEEEYSEEEDDEEDGDEGEDGEEEGDEAVDEEDRAEAFLDAFDEMEEKRLRRLEALEKKKAKRGHKGAVEDEEEEELDDMDLIAEEMYRDDDSDNDEDDNDDDEEGNSKKKSKKNVKSKKSNGSGKLYMAEDFFGPVSSKSKQGKSGNGAVSKTGVAKASSKPKQREVDEEDADEDSEGFDGEDFDDEDGEDDFNEDMLNDEEIDDGVDEEGGFDDEEEEEGEVDGEENPYEADESLDPSMLTTYQRRKARLLEEQRQLEAELLQPKSWEMKGETKAKERPVNSILEMQADIERASKPAPVITLEHTSSIEDMILKRVIEGRYNDVLPPVKRKEAREDAPELSQEKDKMGLGEIYANEFLAKTFEGTDADASKRKGGDEQRKAEIKSLFMKICRSLDALSHFHYTPKPVDQEGAITVHNLPSLMMEDVAPSDSIQLTSTHAPEEIMTKPRSRVELLPEAERTSADRNRFRNAAKRTRRTQRTRESAEAAAANASISAGVVQSQQQLELARLHQSRQLDETLRNDKRVILSTSTGAGSSQENPSKRHKSSGSSADFFAKLKNEVQSGISSKKAQQLKPSNDKSGPITAGRVKL